MFYIKKYIYQGVKNKVKVFIFYGNEIQDQSRSIFFLKSLIRKLNENKTYSEIIVRSASNTKLEPVSNWNQLIEVEENRNLFFKNIQDEIFSSDLILIISPVFIHNVSSYTKIFLDNLALWTHTMPLVGKIGIPISISSNNGNKFVNDYLTKIMNYWGVLTSEPISILLSDCTDEALESYIRYILRVASQLKVNPDEFDYANLELFFNNNINSFSNSENTIEKRLFEGLPYSNCKTFEEAFKLMYSVNNMF